ncbi:MAG: AMP-dependent synthetase and ligase [Frankiales bacterium]|nr:AMP-dependent synthetase and ligase [Frankiales bacterium]
MAKTANLLHDSYDGAEHIGLLLPLHWQTVCLLLGGVAAGTTVNVASSVEQLAGCDVAFVAADQAEQALSAADEVIACSLTPFATRLAELPPMVLDAAVELPGHGDHFSGRPASADVRLDGEPVTAEPLPLDDSDRVLTAMAPATEAGLTGLLGVLSAGAALILLASGDRDQALAQESATAWIDEGGLHSCGG